VGSVGVQCPLGDVDEGARPSPEGMAIYKELVLPFYRVRRAVRTPFIPPSPTTNTGHFARRETLSE
jgi:hypothetical protein